MVKTQPGPELRSTRGDQSERRVTNQWVQAVGEGGELLRVELWAETVPDELVWTLERAKDGQAHCVITLAKADAETTWDTLCRQGGAFECWTIEL